MKNKFKTNSVITLIFLFNFLKKKNASVILFFRMYKGLLSSFQNFSFIVKRKMYGISADNPDNYRDPHRRDCCYTIFNKKVLSHFVLALSFCALFLIAPSTQAQDVEQVIKKFRDNKSPLTLSGGVSLDQAFYESNGIGPRRDPYNYFVGGNLNLGVYEWKIPVSFRFSNQTLNYNLPQAPQQPFNQFGLSPSYKWLTLHGGFRNLTYSPLTLSGHQFLGGGVEVAPGKVVKVSTMYGRMLKAVEYDTTLEANFPTHERYGYGLKTELNIKSTKIALIGFRSSDNANSIDLVPDSIGVRPEENLVLSASIDQSLGKLNINAEYAYSGITLDKNLSSIESDRVFAGFGDLFLVNSSTVFYDAIKAGLSYPIKDLKLGLNYERIDPGYRTHGAYFFNNDLEKYAFSLAFPLLSKKMNVSSNVGIQRNNLDNQKLSSLFRFAGSLNVSWKVTEKLNISTDYSNFISTNNIRNDFALINNTNDFVVLDTLNYQQIAQSLSLSGSYVLSEGEKKSQNINLSTSAQRSVDEQNGERTDAGTLFINGNASYSLSFKESGVTLALGGNYNENLGQGLSNRTFGPNGTLGKSFFDNKLKTSLTSAWNASFRDADRTSRILTLRGNASTTIKKKHSIRLSLAYLNRLLVSPTGPPTFNEFTARLGYSYRFSIKKNPSPEKKKKKE